MFSLFYCEDDERWLLMIKPLHVIGHILQPTTQRLRFNFLILALYKSTYLLTYLLTFVASVWQVLLVS